jgi:hypothetical protein
MSDGDGEGDWAGAGEGDVGCPADTPPQLVTSNAATTVRTAMVERMRGSLQR